MFIFHNRENAGNFVTKVELDHCISYCSLEEISSVVGCC